jgi:hypothetical protein
MLQCSVPNSHILSRPTTPQFCEVQYANARLSPWHGRAGGDFVDPLFEAQFFEMLFFCNVCKKCVFITFLGSQPSFSLLSLDSW